MSNPYVGEIRMFAGNFAPAGWNFCDGSLLSISENETLFVLIGTIYGGDGESTFGVPDLRGRVPIHFGTGGGLSTYVLGQSGGFETVTLTSQQIPSHTHVPLAKNAPGNASSPVGAVPAINTTANAYGAIAGSQFLRAQSIASSGSNQPHDNMQPYMAINYIISLFGIFPSAT